MSIIVLKLEDSMESFENISTSGFDIKDQTVGDSFIRKVNWSEDDWSMYSSENYKTQLDDTMDVCNYRIVEKFNVNRVNVDVTTGWNAFFNDSMYTSQLIDLEDTLDICNYRRGSIECNPPETLAEPTVSMCESVVIEYPPKLKHFLDILAVETVDCIWNQSIELLNESSFDCKVPRLDDTMDVFSYRRRASQMAKQQQVSQPKTPPRCNMDEAKNFNRMVIPKYLFGASTGRNGCPVTSSPVLCSDNQHQN